jgi:hypothetical protein
MSGMAGIVSDPNADPFAQMMAMLNGGAGGPGPEGMPDMSRLLAQMMGGAGAGAPGAEGNMPNLLGMGDLDDPAGLGGVPPLNANGMPNFPDMSAFANMPGMAGMMPGMGAPQGKGWVEKLYPLIHFIGVLVLLAFAVVWWEPTIRAARWANKLDGETTLGRWARLAGRGGVRQVAASGMLGNVEVLVSRPFIEIHGLGHHRNVQLISTADLLGIHHATADPANYPLLHSQGEPENLACPVIITSRGGLP